MPGAEGSHRSRSAWVPDELGPADDESAVLSVLAVRAGSNRCQLVAGSLLTVPADQALTSWRQWAERQPLPAMRRGLGAQGFDLGPVFEIEPFPNVIGIRRVISPHVWQEIVVGLETGEVGVLPKRLTADLGEWSLAGLICQDSESDGHRVVMSAKRPVHGVIARVAAPAMPHSEASWEWKLPPHEPRGRALADMLMARRLLHWPQELLGIDWLGADEFPPPPAFVVGRPVSNAWIVDMRPGNESGHLAVTIGWNADRIDPLSCVLGVRVEHEGAIVLSTNIRISDLPPNPAAKGSSREPRELAWHERTVDVSVPRGPDQTAFGAALYGPDGALLDERCTAPRWERVTVTVGTQPPPEPPAEQLAAEQRARAEAAGLARDLMASARAAAARRRLSSQGDLFDYLCWRFSCVAGDLLVLDAYLLDDPLAPTVALLRRLDRPIRALSRKTPVTVLKDLNASETGQVRLPPITAALAQLPSSADIRLLPNGPDTLHDRVWIVGDTGLLVGGSVNTIPSSSAAGGETTITELPLADVLQWRGLFETWWPKKK